MEFVTVNIEPASFIKGIFFAILLILFSKWIWKDKINIEKSMSIARILLLMSGIYLIIEWALHLYPNIGVLQEFTLFYGPFTIAYFTLLIIMSLLPFTLLINKLQDNYLYIVFISFSFQLLDWFEMIYIKIQNGLDSIFQIFIPSETMVNYMIQGFAIGIVLLLFGNYTDLFNRKTNLDDLIDQKVD